MADTAETGFAARWGLNRARTTAIEGGTQVVGTREPFTQLPKPMPPAKIASTIATACAFMAAPAWGQALCAEGAGYHPSVTMRVDNDLLGGQDEGYTNGVVFTFTSPNLADYTSDPCLPALARGVNPWLTWLQPHPAEQRNMSFSLAQALYTPRDSTRADLITEDRPYAAIIVGTLAYHGRRGNRLDSTLLRLGWVGPSARGEEVQHAIHKVTGSSDFQGWSNQLHDEPVFQLQREWTRRWDGDRPADPSRWNSDALLHWGGSLGTLNTNVLAGAQWRYGKRLPDDFGSLPLWAAGDNTSPSPAGEGDRTGWSGHVFAGADVRWVLHSVTLDGNTWRNSHSVDKRPIVGEVSYGFQLRHGEWKFAMTRYHRSKEFDGQTRRPVFGSFTIARSL